MSNKKETEQILKSLKLKITPARVAVLELLSISDKPLSVEDIYKKLARKDINNVTVYRTLASFKEKGLVKEVYLNKDFVSYELAAHHHHHIVCNGCGDIEDIDLCLDNQTVSGITKQSKKFSSIEDHSLEFFGTCKKCIKK